MQTQVNLKLQYQNQIVSISPFVQLQMGLKAGQTIIKLENYSIICSPYKISLDGAYLVAVFSKDEIVFFQRFINSLAGLSLVFQIGNNQNPVKIFARCIIKSLNAMKGRDALGLIEVSFKPCPPDLENLLIDYFMFEDRLKVEYDDFKGKSIPITADSSKLMGYNNYTQINYDACISKVAVFSLASDSIDFLVPMNGPTLEQGKPLSIKLFFQKYQFSVPGIINDLAILKNGIQKVKANIQFSPELVSIIEQYRFNERLAIHKKQENLAAL